MLYHYSYTELKKQQPDYLTDAVIVTHTQRSELLTCQKRVAGCFFATKGKEHHNYLNIRTCSATCKGSVSTHRTLVMNDGKRKRIKFAMDKNKSCEGRG